MRVLSLILLSGALALIGVPASVPLAAEAMTAETIISRAENRFAALKDYECMVEGEARKGKKRQAGEYHFWFRKPGMLRIHVTKGANRGSDLTIDEAGKVRGRQGGLFKAIVISMSMKDKRLRNIRGNPVTELEWGSFYRKLRDHAGRPGARMSLAERNGAEPYRITLRYSETGKQIREEYSFHPDLWVLVQADYFEDEVRVDHLYFHDIKLDPGLESKFFRL